MATITVNIDAACREMCQKVYFATSCEDAGNSVSIFSKFDCLGDVEASGAKIYKDANCATLADVGYYFHDNNNCGCKNSIRYYWDGSTLTEAQC